MENAWKAAARHWWERMRQAERERDGLLQKLEELRGQPSGIPGEFADLAARIAKADAKHPMDCEDTESHRNADLRLDYARRRLMAEPTWENALRCELAEAMDALACVDVKSFADELLDVSTVAMRWRRAVLERGSR